MRAVYATMVPLLICFRLVTAQDMCFTFQVKHDHFWGEGRGHLTINNRGITFESETDEDHSREWTFADAQGITIESPTEMEIRTYEDVGWKFNQDRKFEFKLTDGEITPETVRFLRRMISTPLVSSVFAAATEAFYTIDVKHVHSLGGGCKGQLTFSPDVLYFSTGQLKHNRIWLIREIESLGRMSRFEFRVTVRENGYGYKNFLFQLMQPMDDHVYENLWSQVYEPESRLLLP